MIIDQIILHSVLEPLCISTQKYAKYTCHFEKKQFYNCVRLLYSQRFRYISVPLLELVDTAQEQTSSQNMDLTENDELTGEKIFQFIFFSSI